MLIVDSVDRRGDGVENAHDRARGTAHQAGINLRPLPFEQLQREFPKVSSPGREQKGLIFGGLIADGFLVVEAERKSVIDRASLIKTRPRLRPRRGRSGHSP